MCGILGKIGTYQRPTFENALNSIKHRGPDGFGIWQSDDQYITLGHRRLSILDLSDFGKQPMHYEHLSIIFNGEIYNFLEIKRELFLKGHKFKSESDTEIILASYLEWGTKCFNKFNGMWALGIWDAKNKELILSRDRFGKKPLFYAYENGSFTFASEMKAITPFLNSINISDDFHWCQNNIFLYEATEKCLINDIKRFPAGHFAILKQNQNQLFCQKYWDTSKEIIKPASTYEEQVEHFRELLVDACKIRMRSDVPIGTLLSGGLDSSSIFAMMNQVELHTNSNRVANDWQHAFVASFPGSFLDEKHYARKVTDHFNLPLEIIDVNEVTDINQLEYYQYLFEDIYITNPIPMVETYKRVRSKGIIVTLDGHGADEYLGGYPTSIYDAFIDSLCDKQQKRMIVDTYQGMINSSGTTNVNIELTKFILRKIGVWGINKMQYFHLTDKHQKIPIPSFPKKENMDYFTSQLYATFHQTIMPTLLRNYDRYSMIAGVESRMPLLDYRLVTYAFSLPWSSKLRNGYSKSLLRDATRPYLPKDISNRKQKIGFNSPINEWIKGTWKEYMLDTVYSKEFMECELINPIHIRKRVEKVIYEPNSNYFESQDTWRYFTTYLWYKTFYKKVSSHNNLD
jgi:asparagine synthase (glutamine-hydrolysing)